MTSVIPRCVTSPFVSLVFRWVLGGVFVFAGWVKAMDPPAFAQAIYNYHLLPGWLINPMAIALPWIEILGGLSLFAGIWVAGGALLASGLLVVFAGALGISLARGLDISCGCFGPSSGGGSIRWLDLLRDLGLLGMAVHVLLFDRGIASVERWFARASGGKTPDGSARKGIYSL